MSGYGKLIKQHLGLVKFYHGFLLHYKGHFVGGMTNLKGERELSLKYLHIHLKVEL